MSRPDSWRLPAAPARGRLAAAACCVSALLLCGAAAWPDPRQDAPPPAAPAPVPAVPAAAEPMPATPVPPPAMLAPFVTLTGADSRVTVERCERITSHEAWAALWLEHLGEPPRAAYDTYYNKAGLPLVDFGSCMVVAVFGGAVTNVAGLRAVPDETDAAALAAAGDVVLALRWNSYQTLGPAPDGGAVAATPYAFFVVPRTPAPLVLVDVRYPMGGGEVRFVERTRFPGLAP